MLRSGQRVVIGLLAGVLVLSAAVVMVNRLVVEAEWWQVDQRVTSEPARWAAQVGPPPGPFVKSWQLATPVRHSGLSPYDQVAHAIVDGQLVVISGKGMDVRDARTGTARWHYYRKSWVLLGWTATRGHLVAYLERAGRRDQRLLLGFDSISGRLLWRNTGEVPSVIERSTLRWPAGSDVLLTTDTGRRVLHGRSAATGARLWTRAVPPGCELPETGVAASGADERLAAVTLACGDRRRIFVVDPATGKVRWVKRLGAGDPPALTVHDDVVTVFDGDMLRAYGAGGQELAVRSGEDLCRPVCPVAVDGGRLYLTYRSGDGTRMDSIDIASARQVWSREVPDYTAVAAAGGRLYALRPRLAEDLLPMGVDVIETGDGATTTVPTPLVVGQGKDAVRSWIAAAGGQLFVAVPDAATQPEIIGGATGSEGGGNGDGGGRLDGSDDPGGAGERGAGDGVGGGAGGAGGADDGRNSGDREVGGGDIGGGGGNSGSIGNAYPARKQQLIALRGGSGGPGPVELGGVAAADWPDACALLGAADLAAIRPGGKPVTYTARPGTARIGNLALPHPVSCTYEPKETRPPSKGEEKSAMVLTVTVEWVAEGPREASALLAAHRISHPMSRPLPGIGDEAAELGTAGTIAVRVDRSIIAVNVYRAPDVANRLARAAAARLRERLIRPLGVTTTPPGTAAPSANPDRPTEPTGSTRPVG